MLTYIYESLVIEILSWVSLVLNKCSILNHLNYLSCVQENRISPALLTRPFLVVWDPREPAKSGNCSIFPRMMMSDSMLSEDLCQKKRVRPILFCIYLFALFHSRMICLLKMLFTIQGMETDKVGELG